MAIREAKPKARNDAYTGLLAISFLALVGATVFMVLDIDQVGKAPAKLTIDVPGTTQGKAGDPLRRPDTGKIDTTDAAPAPAPMPPAPMPMMPPDPGMSKAEPGKLPALPAVEAASDVIPVKAETPAKPADPDGPPLPVKPFVPPM
jgi:hypothetical protein